MAVAIPASAAFAHAVPRPDHSVRATAPDTVTIAPPMMMASTLRLTSIHPPRRGASPGRANRESRSFPPGIQ